MKRHVLPHAAKHIAEIEAYIHQKSFEAAADIAQRIRKAFDLITERPEIGRPTPIPHLREWSSPGLPYVIPYRVRGDTVEILRVFHTRRQRPPRWIG